MAQNKKVFIIGKEDDQPRSYSITLLQPMDGMYLSMKLGKMISKMPIDDIKLSDTPDKATLMALVEALDPDEMMTLVKSILKKTSIFAQINAKDTSLNQEGAFNEWFSAHREDLFVFAFQLIWANVSPFLPEELKLAQKS